MDNDKYSIPLWKRLIFSGIIVITFFFVLEIIARLIVPPRDTLIHQEHEDVITVLGLPALNETMEFDPDLFWRLKKPSACVRMKKFRV